MQCYFCQRKICTSCIVPGDVAGNYSTTKCNTCDRRKINKISILSVLRRNKFILGVLGGFWIYTVFPLPFLQMFGIKIDPTSFQHIFITPAVMTIPFIFMLFAWQKRSPLVVILHRFSNNLKLLTYSVNKKDMLISYYSFFIISRWWKNNKFSKTRHCEL